MTLNLALVIDGENSGAEKALKDTATGVEELGRKSKEAAAPVKEVAESLGAAADQGPKAATGISDMGDAVVAVSPKLTSLKAIVLGTFGGIGAGLVAGGITAAVGFATTAFVNFATEIASAAPRIERDLKSHEALVKRIKGAYEEADDAASSYGLNSRKALQFQVQQDISRLERDLGDSIPRSFDGRERNRGVAADSPFRDAISTIRQDMTDGRADIISFRNDIAEIASTLESNDPFRATAEHILETTQKAADLQAELQRSIDLYKGLTGNADAAAIALGGSSENFELNGEAIATALPFLREYDALLASIGGKSTPVNQSVSPAGFKPFASGGMVNQPTLFSFGAGETGLMGEAGEEAILPAPGGKVGAIGPSGKEIRIGLTRLSGGDLGIDLPKPFAAGGVVRRFATGGVVASGITGVSGGYSRGLGAVGQRIASLEAELGALGQSTEIGAQMRVQLELENLARQDAIGLTPARVTQIEAEATAFGNLTGELERQRAVYDTLKGATVGFFVEVGQASEDGAITLEDWGNAGANAFAKIRDRALAAVGDGVFDLLAGAVSGAFGGGGGGIGASIAGFFGFDQGGWTGDGSVDEIAGFAHKKEFVVRAGPAAQYRPMLEAINNNTPLPANSNGGFVFSPTTNIYAGNGGVTRDEIDRLIDERDRRFGENLGSILGNGRRRAIEGF